MPAIFTRLYRERRRALIVALLTFAAGVAAQWHVAASLFGLPAWLIGGLAFMLILTPVLMALAVVFPSIRHIAEPIAFTLVLLALMGVFGPGPLAFGLPRPPWLNLWVIVLMGLVAQLYAGAWLDRITPARTRTFRSRSTSRLPPDRLWPALATTPETAHLVPDEDRIGIEWVEPGQTLHLISRQGDIAKVEELHHIDAVEPGTLYAFRFEPVDGRPDAPGTTGQCSYRLRPHGPGTEVLSTRSIDRASFRGRLFVWIDDAYGRADDLRIARIEQAALA